MGVGPFELRYNAVTKKAEWVKVRAKGNRKPEWNNPNRKASDRIAMKVAGYEKFIKSPATKNINLAGYHKPGSPKGW